MVAHAHVGHVHAENPEQAIAFAVAQFPERLQELLHAVVVFRLAAVNQTLGIRPAQHRKDAHIRSQDVLQEDHLQLDGMFEGVAVILHVHGRAAVSGQPVHQARIGGRVPRGVRKVLRVRPKRSGSP